MTKIQNTLQRAFATNFMLYYISHVAHVNIVGRNFYNDHQFLDSIYSDAQDNIDTYAEFIRTVDAFMPTKLSKVIDLSEINDTPTDGDCDQILKIVQDAIESMLIALEHLYDASEKAREYGLSNYAQDRMVVHRKQKWMLESILKTKE